MNLDLFLADLESQFDAGRRSDADALVEELTDAERVGVTLAARLLACTGAELTILVRGGRRIRGRVTDVARTWILLTGEGRVWLVPLDAVAAVWPVGGSTADEDTVAHSVGVGHVLRELAHLAEDVVVDHDAGSHQGVIRAVFADHMDLETRTGGPAPDARDRARTEVLTLPLAGVRCLQVRGDARFPR